MANSTANTGSTMGTTTPTPPSVTQATAGDSTAAKAKFDKVKEQAGKLGTQASDKARSLGNQGIERAGGFIGGLAHAAHEIGDKVSARTGTGTEGGGGRISDYAHRAGERLDNYAERLRAKDIDDVIEDVRATVRRHPAIAVGAAVAAGFLLSRLFKSGRTADSLASAQRRTGYDAASQRRSGNGARFDSDVGGHA